MTQLWLKVSAKYEALSERERIAVLVAALLLAVYTVFALTIEPAQKRSRILRDRVAQQKAELESMRARHLAGTPVATDPDAAKRVRGEELKRSVVELDEKLKAMQRELVSADRMSALLRDVLARDPGLHLVGLRTLPVAPLIARADSNASPGAPAAPRSSPTDANVYKHGVEITVTGSYANLHAYLKRLEQSPWRMFWWRARLSADGEARLTMVITIYTLSLDRAWLQV